MNAGWNVCSSLEDFLVGSIYWCNDEGSHTRIRLCNIDICHMPPSLAVALASALVGMERNPESRNVFEYHGVELFSLELQGFSSSSLVVLHCLLHFRVQGFCSSAAAGAGGAGAGAAAPWLGSGAH